MTDAIAPVWNFALFFATSYAYRLFVTTMSTRLGGADQNGLDNDKDPKVLRTLDVFG